MNNTQVTKVFIRTQFQNQNILRSLYLLYPLMGEDQSQI